GKAPERDTGAAEPAVLHEAPGAAEEISEAAARQVPDAGRNVSEGGDELGRDGDESRGAGMVVQVFMANDLDSSVGDGLRHALRDAEGSGDTRRTELLEQVIRSRGAGAAPAAGTEVRTAGQAETTVDYVTHRTAAAVGPTFQHIKPIQVSDSAAEANGTEAPRLATVRQDLTDAAHPALHVSADGTLAASTENESREAFASRGAFERSRRQLHAVGGAVRLELDESVSLTVRHDGAERTLYRVRPVFLEDTTDVCRDLAGQVMGGTADHLVFRAPDGQTVLGPMNAADSLKVSELHHLAHALVQVADGSASPGVVPDTFWAVAKASGRGPLTPLLPSSDALPPTPLPGRRYGPLLNPNSRGLDKTARAIGINQDAWPAVGEAYLTQSIGSENEHGEFTLEDHTGALHPVDNPFGYHYAAVVLASEDGTSHVTLENYARQSGTRHALRNAVDRNLDEHGDRLEEMRTAYEAETETATELRERASARAAVLAVDALIAVRDERAAAPGARNASDAAATGPTTAEQKAVSALAQLSGEQGRLKAPGDLWHMRFVSRQEQETFHDQMTGGSECVVNPLTAVVVGAHEAPDPLGSSFTFDEKATRPTEDDRRTLYALAGKVARIALWNRRNGLPLPRVVVSTGGNGRRDDLSAFLNANDPAHATGERRLEAARSEFLKQLDEALAHFQRGADPADVLRADEFEVQGENRGRLLPQNAVPSRLGAKSDPRELRRRAIFTIELHPAGERPAPPNADVTQLETTADEYRRPTEVDGALDETVSGAETDVAPGGALGYRARIALAKREWKEPVAKAVADLERLLDEAGSGARSLVIGAVPDKPLWAINVGGAIRWMDNTGESTQAPLTATGKIVSIDLDPFARLIDPALQLVQAGPGASGFCDLTLGADLKNVV
ncbi:hypothetical protein ACFC0P_11010, partial [Streptomyces broussonetiae]